MSFALRYRGNSHGISKFKSFATYSMTFNLDNIHFFPQKNCGNSHGILKFKPFAKLSSCPSIRVMCPSVRVSWTGLSFVRLALGLQEGKLGVTLAYVVDTSHSKRALPKLEHAPKLTRRRL